MKHFIVFLLFLPVQNLFGQNIRPSKNQLSNIFKSSIRQVSKLNIQTSSNPWLICNTDSSFFKSDTVILYDNINFYYQSKSCCNFIGWTFYKKKSFIQIESQVCKEPSSVRYESHNTYFTIKISEMERRTILEIFQNNLLMEFFDVISYRKEQIAITKESFKKLILVRQRK